MIAHKWVPLDKCGELKPGQYMVRGARGPKGCTWASSHCIWGSGKWWINSGRGWSRAIVTHVLSPAMGPIPEYELP